MKPWQELATTTASDGVPLALRRRGEEFLITAGGHDLMSSEDEGSAKALATLGCAHLGKATGSRVLVGGLGMGYTLRAALDEVADDALVEVAELVPDIVDWNRTFLGALADRPLEDPRVRVVVGDVRERLRAATDELDAVLLDVDNGPQALAHPSNRGIYSHRGLAHAWRALRRGGVLGVWSFADEKAFTRRLQRQRFRVETHRVPASRRGRGRYHFIWVAKKS